MTGRPFILASASPRRVALLREAGFVFEIEPADLDESDVPPGLSPRGLAIHLACAKAAAVAARHRGLSGGRVVLGADTVVAVGQTLYGKAETPAEAFTMLRALAGTRQSVITGVAVCDSEGRAIFDAEESIVEMKPMSDTEIGSYVESGQWRGKAGAYGLQDHDPASDPFVSLVSGAFDNVVGLPVALARQLLASMGVRIEGER